jgi:hypothetical protein
VEPPDGRRVVPDGQDAVLATLGFDTREPNVDSHPEELKKVVYSNVSVNRASLRDSEAPGSSG